MAFEVLSNVWEFHILVHRVVSGPVYFAKEMLKISQDVSHSVLSLLTIERFFTGCLTRVFQVLKLFTNFTNFFTAQNLPQNFEQGFVHVFVSDTGGIKTGFLALTCPTLCLQKRVMLPLFGSLSSAAGPSPLCKNFHKIILNRLM